MQAFAALLGILEGGSGVSVDERRHAVPCLVRVDVDAQIVGERVPYSDLYDSRSRFPIATNFDLDPRIRGVLQKSRAVPTRDLTVVLDDSSLERVADRL